MDDDLADRSTRDGRVAIAGCAVCTRAGGLPSGAAVARFEYSLSGEGDDGLWLVISRADVDDVQVSCVGRCGGCHDCDGTSFQGRELISYADGIGARRPTRSTVKGAPNATASGRDMDRHGGGRVDRNGIDASADPKIT